MNTRETYERPKITTLDAAAVVKLIGPALASPSGGPQPDPQGDLHRSASGNAHMNQGK